ncbi:HvfC/BufC N-terminal domain-containing protein [Crenobacter intestini]|uniref:DUF2063 domain-containing protein n=1 Tax=Crenobacter intestini TaxID=2563443 RepID=A0A4T0V233_9NEIS|nr:DNA-binding domain-containing protein [Crenobacter intestini]TIC85347.1 DUF2063 domain-containing protein [Crenobacter intestini]
MNSFDYAGFAAALWGRGDAGGLVAQPGFAVYRNTVISGCVDALIANHPSLVTLMGEAWLAGCARDYVRAYPPQDAYLVRYGAGFAAFASGMPGAEAWPWLGQVGALDYGWLECHLAADADPVPAASLAALAADTALAPHPAARWVWSGQWPLWQLWSSARSGCPPENLQWQGEGVLLSRPAGEVLACPVPQEACVFLDALAAGQALDGAVDAVCAAVASPDFSGLMQQLAGAGALVPR